MLFLSLFMDLMMLLNIGAAQGQGDYAAVSTPDHTIHGHLPGPVAPHFDGLASHLHHGQHGHDVGASGHEVFH